MGVWRCLVRMTSGGFYGVVAGGLFGLAVAAALAPEHDPRSPTRHEWWNLLALGYVLWSGLGGMATGVLVGACPRLPTWVGVGAGLLAGTAAGCFAWASGPSPPHHAYTGLTIVWPAAAGSLLGAALGAACSAARHTPPDPHHRP